MSFRARNRDSSFDSHARGRVALRSDDPLESRRNRSTLATSGDCFLSCLGMNSQGKTPALTFTGTMVLWATLTAGLTFGMNYIYGNRFERRNEVPDRQSTLPSLGTFIVPVGGAMMDGVYRASAEDPDWSPYPFATLSGCADVTPKAGTSTASTLRTSSKL